MNTTRNRSIISATIALLALMVTSSAAFGRGSGIKAGDGRLHFGVDLELTYDTNPSYQSSDAADIYSDLMLRVRPGLALEFPSDMVSFDLNGKVGYDYYFGVVESRTTDLSTITGNADMKLGFNPNGQFSFYIEDMFSRSGDPRYTVYTGRLDRTTNEAKAHFEIKPGGGALMFDLAYGFFLDWFDDSSNVDLSGASSYAHRVYFSGKWKFLPKTALALDFDSDIRRYLNTYDDGTRNVDVNAIRATLGLIGQISPSISLVVKAGYGDSLVAAGSNYRSVIGQAELSMQLATTFLQVGYSRNFQPVVLFTYFGQDRFYVKFRQQIAGRFSLLADVGFDLLGYGNSTRPEVNAQGGRFDYFLSGGAAFEYHILDWIGLALDYRLQVLFSDYLMPQAGTNVGAGYNKHAITLRLSIDY